MTTSKIILTLLILFCSILVTSQTFVLNGSTYIGKTKKEINKINKASNSKLFSNKKDGRVTSIIYYDSLNTLTNHFFFARRGPFGIGPWKCFSYLVNVGDKSQFEKIKVDLLTKCEEKISDKRAIQVSGRRKYEWVYTSSDKSELYTFIVQKPHKKSNNR
jgi:hypothetical protein